MRKRILSALLAVMFLFTGLPGTAWAVGEGNMEAGGGQTETVTGDSFWNGDWGIRFCVVDVASQTVVSATYDAANKSSGYENYIHFGKTNKFDYRGGASLSFQQSNYSWETPDVSIPTIVRTSGAPDIKAIKDYFTDETVIRWIGDVTGMAYDTLISGDYKLFIEPILYYTFDSQKYAMTATEAALFDRAINGLLLRTMGNATHQQLPLSLYLEKSDLGFSKWAGAKTGIQNDTNIINYLGMGIVSFIPEEEPEPGTGGNGDGPTVPISFRKTDPERFNAANYNTGLITFAPASSNSAAFDNISGAVIEISGDGTGAGTYELPCTVELGEGTFTVREVAPPYGYLLNDAWSAEITVEVEKDGEGKPVEGAEAEATITVSGGGGTDGTSYASVEDYRQRGQLTVTKVDNETISLNHGNYRTPQGDATFAGAVFELRAAKDIYLPSTWIKIYSEGDLVATAVTGNDGSFTINGIEQGVYTLQEITPSDGYVFQGAKARGQIYTITNAYTGSGTNILSFDDKAAGDTGNKNQYANTVIKADLTLTKFNENRTVENEMDGNAYEMNKQPAEGVYFAVYLNSKAAAGGNPIYSTTDDPVGDGTSGSASTAGWGYLDLVNHNFYSPLPDEWFKQRDLDANNPLPNGNPSVEEGRAEETDLAKISMKDLYMVLRTDSTGRATTLDPSTVVYCSWGELGNSAANGTAGIDYRLPYGLYTIIELNPYEGREPDMFEVFIGRDPEAEPATAPTETKSGSGEDYPYTSGWYDFNYNYILENKTLKQTVTVRKTDAQSGKTIPAANTTYRIWSWDNISANGVTEHPLRPYTRKIVAGDGTVTADTVVPPTVSMDYSSLTIAPGESAAAPELSLDFVGPAAVVLKDGTKAISWTAAEQAEIKTDFANAYAVYIADAGVAKAEQKTDGSWSIIGVAAGTTKYSVRLPGGQAITGTVKVADGAATATNSPVTWKVDGHWIHQTISYPNPHTLTDFKTDATGTFTMPDYLVYGDYLLYEIESPEGYVQAEPFAYSNCFNPLEYLEREDEVMALVDTFVFNSRTDGTGQGDQFWEDSMAMLLTSVLTYLVQTEGEEKTFARALELIGGLVVIKGEIMPFSPYEIQMRILEATDPGNAALTFYKQFKQAPAETLQSILISTTSRLRLWNITDVKILTARDEMDIDGLVEEKTVLYLVLPPQNRTYRVISAMFLSTLFSYIQRKAEREGGGKLPVPLALLLDEFANLGKINDFSTILTLVRSYGIRVVPIIQSVQQLEHNYDKDEDTIVSNCAIYNYLGTNSVKTREDLVKRLGKTTITEENSSRNTGGKQGGGSLSDRGVGRELLTVDELAVIDAENKNSIVLMGGRPFFCEKFRTQKHPLFSRIGNDIKGSAGYANNRSIEEDYARLALQHREQYEKECRGEQLMEAGFAEGLKEVEEGGKAQELGVRPPLTVQLLQQQRERNKQQGPEQTNYQRQEESKHEYSENNLWRELDG